MIETNLDINSLLPEDIKTLIKNLQVLLVKKEESKNTIGEIADFERERIICPKCKKENVRKDGLYKGRQKYECKECGKKFNSLTNTPFHHTHLNYKQIETAYQCLVDKVSIRKTAIKMGTSSWTAFVTRFKLISCLKQQREETKLSGNIELDEYYLSINLKGTKKQNMPRISKKRKKNGTGKQGISNHTVCITSGVDENDNIFFEVAGTSNVSTKMIKDTVVPKIVNSKKVITDCKSSYEEPAKEEMWNLKQVKSTGYTDLEGNNLANINSLHSQLTLFLSQFHGVSTKHLQEYLDWFVFLKHLTYKVEYLEQAHEFEKNTITINSRINYSNVCDNHSIFDFNKVYEDYDHHPSNSTT